MHFFSVFCSMISNHLEPNQINQIEDKVQKRCIPQTSQKIPKDTKRHNNKRFLLTQQINTFQWLFKPHFSSKPQVFQHLLWTQLSEHSWVTWPFQSWLSSSVWCLIYGDSTCCVFILFLDVCFIVGLLLNCWSFACFVWCLLCFSPGIQGKTTREHVEVQLLHSWGWKMRKNEIQVALPFWNVAFLTGRITRNRWMLHHLIFAFGGSWSARRITRRSASHAKTWRWPRWGGQKDCGCCGWRCETTPFGQTTLQFSWVFLSRWGIYQQLQIIWVSFRKHVNLGRAVEVQHG